MLIQTSLALVAAIACAPIFDCTQAQPAQRPLIIGVLSYEKGAADAPDSISRSAERGLRMGIDEAEQTARLFGRGIQEKRVVVKRSDDALHAARVMARTTNMSALLVTNPELIPAADGVPAQRYAVVVMRTLPSTFPFDCSNFSFEVYPGADRLAAVARPAGSVAAPWSPSLERFGALELNDRYRSRWKTGMTGEAWAMWAAVKIVSEASLRTRSVEPFIILDYIKKSEFDGHKGWPLTFRAADHLLRQPIYIVVPPDLRVRDELPGGGRSETESAAEILDSILPASPGASCPSK